jgi:hypothetical protein
MMWGLEPSEIPHTLLWPVNCSNTASLTRTSMLKLLAFAAGLPWGALLTPGCPRN